MTDGRPALSARQKQAMAFLAKYIERNGHSPSLHEVARALGGINVNGARQHLIALERKGVITRREGVPRSIRICQSKPKRRPARKK